MSTVSVIVASEGQVMDPTFELLALDIVTEVNRIPFAQLTLKDGDVAKREFPLSSGAFFGIGKQMEIKLRYEGDPKTEKIVFKGQVMAQSIESRSSGSVLNVELKHVAVKMTQLRSYAVFNDQSDNLIISSLLTSYGLSGSVEDTKTIHKEVVQFGCSDWDFLLVRAELNSLLIAIDVDAVSARKMSLDVTPRHSFQYGLDEIFGFDLEAQATGQLKQVTSLSWDIQQQKMVGSDSAAPPTLTPGNLTPESVAASVANRPYVLANSAPIDSAEAKAWASARLARSHLAMIRGRVSIRGTGTPKLLQTVSLMGFGDRFNGKALITGVRHRVTADGWITDVQLGLSEKFSVSRPDLPPPVAAELIPPMAGLHIGVVANFEEDPAKQYRVRIKIPALGNDKNLLWARLVSPDGGTKRGYFFRPEVGDEVVVGFFNDDPRHPVILGSMYSSANPPPDRFAKLTAENPAKGIVTKGGTVVAFDDEKHTVTIETPSGNKVLLDDDGKAICIADQHKNQIILDQNGITLESARDFKLTAKGQVEISGSKVDIK